MFRIEDLRTVCCSAGPFGVYRIGAHIPTRESTPRAGAALQPVGGIVLGIFDLFSGQLRRLTIFALGIMPYITSSIILQLMTVVFPYLERLQKRVSLAGARYAIHALLTIVLSIIQSFTIAQTLQSASGQRPVDGLPPDLALR